MKSTIDLHKPQTYVADLRDDILVNKTKDLYNFVENDLEKCFYTGYILSEELTKLELEKYYLYSKQFRHVRDNLEQYDNQLEYWQKKYYSEHDEVSALDVLTYVLNNFFFNSNQDAINMAIYLGQYMYNKQKKDEIPNQSGELSIS